MEKKSAKDERIVYEQMYITDCQIKSGISEYKAYEEFGLFTGGLGAHAGAENIGASVIPMSSGNTEKQITLMHDFGSTVLCCTPSYALYLADAIKDSGLPREEFQLKVGAFGAEPWTENMRHEIEEKLGIKAYDIYGLSEIAGPGVGYECECVRWTKNPTISR